MTKERMGEQPDWEQVEAAMTRGWLECPLASADERFELAMQAAHALLNPQPPEWWVDTLGHVRNSESDLIKCLSADPDGYEEDRALAERVAHHLNGECTEPFDTLVGLVRGHLDDPDPDVELWCERFATALDALDAIDAAKEMGNG